jgi:3-methyladenine DNA glycosylase/8-oxoguanine DNA glycosylase
MGYRRDFILAYHGRDALSVSERVVEHSILKPILLDGTPALLTVDLSQAVGRSEPRAAWRLDRAIEPTQAPAVEAMVARMIGLLSSTEAFEALPAAATILGNRHGLRIPLTATLWESVCWAVIGQQINLAFCAALRRSMIERTGIMHEASGLRVHPDPAEIAALDPAILTAERFSRSKARYLIGAAQAIAEGSLPLDAMAALPAGEVEAALCALHGIGPWTARYILLRGFGFADVAPVGDSGLATALQRLLDLPARPDAKAQEAAMLAYSPHRSLATTHLWASLAAPASIVSSGANPGARV